MTPDALRAQPRSIGCRTRLLVCATLVALCCAAASGEERRVSFDMPAQPLTNALVGFADRTGMTALIDGELAGELQSSPVKGRLAPQDALRILLAGTGLSIRYSDSHAFTVGLAQSSAPLRAGSGDDRGAYFLKVQDAVERSLCGNGETRPGNYRAAFQIWVADSGAVQAVHLLGSTGDEARDATIENRLNGNNVTPPPPNLPQPLTIILQRRAAAMACPPPGRS